MSDATGQRLLPRTVVAGALALGLVGGGYGIASAASGPGGSTATTPAATGSTTPALPALAPSATGAQHGWGGQRSDETPLTGSALASVTSAATAKVPGATVVRVETDADGNAAYEVHVTKADGSLATVYVDESFDVVSVESR